MNDDFDSIWHQASQEFADATCERKLEQSTLCAVTGEHLVKAQAARPLKKFVRTNGQLVTDQNHLVVSFSGSAGPYQLRIIFPHLLSDSNGISVRFRLADWQSIRYLAIGYTRGLRFTHVKIPNPSQAEWVTFSLGFRDLAFSLGNDWKTINGDDVGEVRFYVSGTPAHSGSLVECKWVGAWIESPDLRWKNVTFSENEKAFERLAKYFSRCNPNSDEHVRTFLDTGMMPITGDVYLDWPVEDPFPTALRNSVTYRYVWHSLQFVTHLVTYGYVNDHLGAIHAAARITDNWLENSYYNIDLDSKYAWYDHGTAERLMALLMIHNVGLKHQFDFRFMSRLRSAIVRHAHLLESESFYACHQRNRYHNHAWFQDIALMAAAVFLQELPCSRRWALRAKERLEDQLAQLVVREKAYAVFVENSIGYHHGIQRLVDFASDLLSLMKLESIVRSVSGELENWSEQLRYPDNRSPSQGDTFRKPNLSIREKRSEVFDKESYPSVTTLESAGYSVVRGIHESKPFMLCFFASSRSATHKHEDNLSFTLYFDQIEWFIDPSFYSHDYDDRIPAYLRSAEAHNNIWIESANYCIDPGLASNSGTQSNGKFQIDGQHSAYEGFCVSRKLTGCLNEIEIEGSDSVMKSGSTPVQDCTARLVFHFGEGVCVERKEGGVELSHPLSRHHLLLELGRDDFLLFFGEGGEKISVAGAGFEQANETWTLHVPVSIGTPVSWRVTSD